MSARETLTPELRAEVLRLEDDLRARVASITQVQEAWRAEYDVALAAERTAAAWEVWVDERVTLAAVAWVLTTVFIRFCEDNALVKPVWISGPRQREAIDAQQQFLRETARTNADVTDREWLLQPVDYLKSLPATAGLVDDASPMWLVTPSGDAATRLLNYWRERDENGNLVRDLVDPDLDTRFLGDLYQEISEEAKKHYALLQTPIFVEEFILDRTLEPALRERPLEGFKMIDPTCGSGHFLLGGFQRLLDRWHKHAPGLDERERVQAALNSVYGVDINPFAVAIARFRLTVAALVAARVRKLEDAPAFNYHLAAGDSLLHGLDQLEFDLGVDLLADQAAARLAHGTANLETLRSILRNRQYDVVVGNPPYIQPPDKALSVLYRRRYGSCSGIYALSVPFMERFFMLANDGGWVGKITSNSFMKRKFGKKLVLDFLPTKDLIEVIDTEGVWMAGHNMDGTPTVTLVGRNRPPTLSTVKCVLGKGLRESPSDDGGRGPLWSGTVAHIDSDSYDDDWVTVAALDRSLLRQFPLSLAGGSALELVSLMRKTPMRVRDFVVRVGYMAMSHADDAFNLPPAVVERRRLEVSLSQPLAPGDRVRDYVAWPDEICWFPYEQRRFKSPEHAPGWLRFFWPLRTSLGNRATFSGTYFSDGKHWLEWHQVPRDERADDQVLAYAEIASHNHFHLGDGATLFPQTAPVLRFPAGVSSSTLHGMLAILNSSLICFWMKDQSKPKGGKADEAWARTYQFASTNTLDIPVPAELPANFGAQMHAAAEQMSGMLDIPGIPTAAALEAAENSFYRLRETLVFLQEEVDWWAYHSFGLTDDPLVMPSDFTLGLRPGQRAFEFLLARGALAGVAAPSWPSLVSRATPATSPADWPDAYRELVERRMEAIQSNPFIGLVERPECKRPWAGGDWPEMRRRLLRDWLLDRLETAQIWFDEQSRVTPKSLAALADVLNRDSDFVAVLALWEERRDAPMIKSLEALLIPQSVPYLAAHRYRESGMRKRSAWEETWRIQRLADSNQSAALRPEGSDQPGTPVPPEFSSGDFARSEYWSNRGKFDLPKERFISYPNAGREGDSSTVVGWAGWDHSQQALALATLIQSGEQQGWAEERLTPLVAGLSELLPWVEQWHSSPDPLYGGSSPAEFFAGLLDNYMAKIGATRESLAAWRPPAVTRGRKTKS